ncbi:MAG: hypothetical protein JNM76_14010 [Betaproteobacteria bacterium]|nr:hypothetical protein [Betaproteobacteria bacterium]
MKRPAPLFLTCLLAALLTGCFGAFTDPATRLAADLKDAAALVGKDAGARHTHIHRTPSRAGECAGPYRVQIDQVGALIVWCKSETTGETLTSHSTTSHGDTVAARETFIVDKRPSEDLTIDLARIEGKVTVVAVR